jgi:nuclear GTP-binding protein
MQLIQVKEHGRKVAKAARKSGGKAKQPADPGLPNQWPFKQELIKELEEKRQLILAAEKRKKQDRKRTRVGLPNYAPTISYLPL